MIAFIQPFAVYASGGGSRILRALLETDHPPALSIYTGFLPAPKSESIEEIELPIRPRFGRIERSRFQPRLMVLNRVFEPSFKAKLRRLVRDRGIQAFHIIPHGYDVIGAVSVAEEMGLPYFINVHDDLEYLSSGLPWSARMLAAMAVAWRNAKGIYVISDAMGQEYSRRYGAREYQVVTDGLMEVAPGPLPRPAKSLRIYFMGLFHYRYQPNLRALLDALKILRARHSDWNIAVTLRCGSIFGEIAPDDVAVTVLPFGPESEVVKDMQSADLLYQPLPFGASSANFGKFSLSTKLVTYLGSGLPILYHGPEYSAACALLQKRHAAVTCTSIDPDEIAKDIEVSMARRDEIVRNALALGHERFMLADQQRRFWAPIREVLEAAR